MGSPEDPGTEISKPPAIQIAQLLRKRIISIRACQTIVLVVTFLAYASYHASRKTTSIVKHVLDPDSREMRLSPWPTSHFLKANHVQPIVGTPGWAPFNGKDGTTMLGEMDLAFLSVYSIGMYFSGHLGDRFDLRLFLTIGMLGTGLFTSLFGAAYWFNIHNFVYFLVIQMLAGLFQSTGWPSVVAVVGNWFGKSKRGLIIYLIMGIWNAHTSIGNISGSLIASSALRYGWGWSFVLSGLLISLTGLLVFLVLPVNPENAGLSKDGNCSKDPYTELGVEEPLLKSVNGEKEKAVGFIEAWRIPGVAPFALCLFFSKLVAYTFLYWLPFYISHTAIDGKYLSDEMAGNLSTIFDVGGVVGGILAGHLSDRLDARAITAAGFMYCAIPALFFYRMHGNVSFYMNTALMLIAGMFVNGPYALITTAVSADLGTHGSLNGNSRALATVTAIIDGTGSIGAALGPMLTGYISVKSWNGVFVMLMVSAAIAGLLLTRLVMAEIAAKLQKARPLIGNVSLEV